MNMHHALGRLSDITNASWDDMRYLRSNWTAIGRVGRMFPRLHYVCFGQKQFIPSVQTPAPENPVAEQEEQFSELLPVRVQDAVRPSTNRQSFFGLLQTLGGVGLEIGPLHAPICRRDTHNIRYIDAFTTEELKAHYASDPNVPVDNIVDVDYVWRGEPYEDLIPERFDYVVSSHNIEHVPCLVDFLSNLSSCLHPGGKIFMAIPDKRYCFDHFKPESSIAEVLDAHFTKRRKPDPWHIVRHELLRTHNSPIDHWSGEHGRPAYMIDGNFFVQGDIPPDSMAGIYSPQKHEVSEPLLERLKGHYSCSEYHDTHVWIMTPFSFARIVDFLTAHRLVSLELSELYPTEPNSHEFYAVLSKS